MKKTALILGLLLCLTGTAFAGSAGFMGSGGQTVVAGACAIDCSGDWSAGDTESFEDADGSFCTSGIASDETGGAVINEKDTGEQGPVNGCTASVSFTTDAADETAYVYENVGADAEFTVDFWTKAPDVSGWANQNAWFIWMGYQYASSGERAWVLWKLDGSDLKLGCALSESTTYYQSSSADHVFTQGDWYRIHIFFSQNAAGTIDVYDSSNNHVGTQYTVTCKDATLQTHRIGITSATCGDASNVFYMDNITYDPDGAS